jgi:hypothetical protein
MLIVLIVILLLLAIGGLPHWPYAQGWGYGYYPSGISLLLIVILLIFLLRGSI